MILKEYRYAELENFNRKYQAEWRQRFFHNYDVKVTPITVTI
jgi:lysylphosphatidylglycerol synthetase-like protein (DUF2156 family)